MLWGLGLSDWGSLSGRPVTHLFFQLVQMVLVPLGAADVTGDGGWG